MKMYQIQADNKISIPDNYHNKINILFIAKHDLGDGSRDNTDGNHAIYHREVRDTLEGMGLNVAHAF